VTANGDGPGRLPIAATLLSKAASSDFENERASFATRAYKELAAYLNSLDSVPPSKRRRERRLLIDRRQDGRRLAKEKGPEPASSDKARNRLVVDLIDRTYRLPSQPDPLYDARL
jgi:hypothetical protein